MICIIDFAREHVLLKSACRRSDSRDRETMGNSKFVQKAKTKRSLREKYHEVNI